MPRPGVIARSLKRAVADGDVVQGNSLYTLSGSFKKHLNKAVAGFFMTKPEPVAYMGMHNGRQLEGDSEGVGGNPNLGRGQTRMLEIRRRRQPLRRGL